MPLFAPDICLPRDPTGFGRWRAGHALEHQQFIPLAAALSPPVTVPDYDLMFWNDSPAVVRLWLEAHQRVHATLDEASNATNIDFSQVDLTRDDQWFIWMDDHATAHEGYRSFFGLT